MLVLTNELLTSTTMMSHPSYSSIVTVKTIASSDVVVFKAYSRDKHSLVGFHWTPLFLWLFCCYIFLHCRFSLFRYSLIVLFQVFIINRLITSLHIKLVHLLGKRIRPFFSKRLKSLMQKISFWKTCAFFRCIIS